MKNANPIYEKDRSKRKLVPVMAFNIEFSNGHVRHYQTLKAALICASRSIADNLIRTRYTRPAKMVRKYWNKQNDPARIAWYTYCDGLTAKAHRRLVRLFKVG